MRKRIFGLAVAASLAVMSASAADLPSHKGPPPVYIPPPPPMMTWTGIYVGLNLGGGWLERYNYGYWLPFSNGSNPGGVIGGGQIGYNYQFTPLLVAGLEADFQGSTIGSGGNQFWGATRSVDWFGTMRGRAGVSLLNSQLLLYGTGGFAYGDLNLNYGWLGSQSRVATGWTTGAGLEYAFLPNWSGRVEYLYANMGANYGPTYAGPFVIETQQRAHLNTIRAGVNYRFNWLFAPAGPPIGAY
ncbi:MAG: outer membrane beta-barrel protein [Methylocystis sp.]